MDTMEVIMEVIIEITSNVNNIIIAIMEVILESTTQQRDGGKVKMYICSNCDISST